MSRTGGLLRTANPAGWGLRGWLWLLVVLVGAGTLGVMLRRDAAYGSELLVAELGGETTAFTSNVNAFDLPARNLTDEERRLAKVGDSFFTQNWVTAPASTAARDGLGPLFNAAACSSCHSHDGRSRLPTSDDDPARGLLLRLSVPGTDEHGGPLGDPIYGGQLQDRSIETVLTEGRIQIEWAEVSGAYADGTTYTLRMPHFSLADLAYGDPAPGIMLSPRIAPQVIGQGLLQSIPESRLVELADPDDADGDGISGRVNYVWDVRAGKTSVGRFGWKAGQPTVEQQIAAAFIGDVGVTSELFPVESCTSEQYRCQVVPNGGSPELDPDRLEAVTFYASTLAVPAMRDVDDEAVQRGAGVFLRLGCDACHTPTHVTGDEAITAALTGQEIHPFTDLLLHDMGEGLADGRPEFLATGTEWRTPPLWGIGLIETVNGHTEYLHDGRARNLEEAILWHGGEAKASRDAFKALSREDREALIRFLKSL